jgi:hypothetical protein
MKYWTWALEDIDFGIDYDQQRKYLVIFCNDTYTAGAC